jgi:NAD(P)-dependent dehydrogenase (short-subunit alcohol dehydrogenase family)
MGLLDGKVALITGGAGEIGGAVARLFRSEGAQVVICDRGTSPDGTGADPQVAPARAAELSAGPSGPAGAAGAGNVVACDHDVTTEAGASAAVDTAVERFGRLDVLVNAAGAVADAPFVEMQGQHWDRIVAIHVKATFLCTQHAARSMIEAGGGGRIVNITSAAGLYGARAQSSYVTAKAAVYGLTRAAAIDLERLGITVNAIAPVARTRLTSEQPQLEGLAPIMAEHVAPAILFLGSDLCGERTGEVLGVGGSRVYRLKIAESQGAFKDGHEPWTAEEIAQHWDRLGRFK